MHHAAVEQFALDANTALDRADADAYAAAVAHLKALDDKVWL
jgi:hypothetical protein